MEQDIQEALDMVVTLLAAYGLNVIGAIFIIIVGLVAAGWAKNAVEKALRRSRRIDEMLAKFLASLVRYAVIAFVIIAALEQFGFEATSLVAVVGAAGLAIGLAMQGTLSNVAAGVMLLLFRPFKVGDYIEAGGQAGTVKEVGLFTCEFSTPDNVKIVIPNGQIWNQAVKNYSANPTRRCDFVIGIDYEDDINVAMATIARVFEEEARGLKDPAPTIAVSEMADSSVNLIARLWVNTPDYWATRWDLMKKLKEELEADGISIPFPQRTVHMVAPPANGPEAPRTPATPEATAAE